MSKKTNSKNTKGKATMPTQSFPNPFDYVHDQQEFPSTNSYQRNEHFNSGTMQNTSNCYLPQHNPNLYQSQQNSNHFQNTQVSTYGRNPSVQQSYISQPYSSPNSQHQSTFPDTSLNLSRNLNMLFGDNGLENDEMGNDSNEIYESAGIRPPMKKQVKWSPDEQAELAYCWVQCSKDNVKGTSQTESSFWNSVCKLFNGRSPHNHARSVDSLKQSWKRINACCQLWNGIMSGLASRQQSGANDMDLLSEANAVYMAKSKNQPFTMQKCYDILCREDKWSNVRHEHTTQRFMPLRPTEDVSPGSTNPSEDTPFATSSGGRPPGRYKANKKPTKDYSQYYEQLDGRMAVAEESNREYIEAKEAARRERRERGEERQRRHEEMQQTRINELELRKAELARQQNADDFALMSVKLDDLNPIQRRYMEKRLEEYQRRNVD